MIRELLTRLTAAGANGVNLNIVQQGDRAVVMIQPKLNPMPYDSSPEGLKIHAAMQKPLVINAELDELDTELHVVVDNYLASFEGAMQTSNVNTVLTEHTAATLTELTSKKAASTAPASKKGNKQTAKASTPASKPEPEQETPATDALAADTTATETQTEQAAQPAASMADFEALFASSASTDSTNTNQ